MTGAVSGGRGHWPACGDAGAGAKSWEDRLSGRSGRPPAVAPKHQLFRLPLKAPMAAARAAIGVTATHTAGRPGVERLEGKGAPRRRIDFLVVSCCRRSDEQIGPREQRGQVNVIDQALPSTGGRARATFRQIVRGGRQFAREIVEREEKCAGHSAPWPRGQGRRRAGSVPSAKYRSHGHFVAPAQRRRCAMFGPICVRGADQFVPVSGGAH